MVYLKRTIAFIFVALLIALLSITSILYAASNTTAIVVFSGNIDPEVKRDVLDDGRAEAVIIARDMDSLNRIVDLLGSKVVRKYSFAPYALVDVSINDLSWLALDLGIEAVAPNFKFRIQSIQLYPVNYEMMQQDELSVRSLVNWALFRMAVGPTWKEFRVTGEDIIIDGVCTVPYLIDFILEYQEALVNKERRVKELFKSFDDEDEVIVEEEDEEGSKRDNKRVEKVLESFKALEKAKKDWEKFKVDENEKDIAKKTHQILIKTYKKHIVK
jgi:hypothetical protein